MRCITIFILICSYIPCFTQSDLENQERYWTYRDRLHKNFLRIGSDDGKSIPASARRIGYPFNFWDENNPILVENSSIYWADATIYLGHYIMVLASEFSLLNEAGQDTEATINELYFALEALERLDINAEVYLSEGNNTLTSDDLNGFLLRDDIGESFWTNFQNDHSVIFNQDCNFDRVESDFYKTDPFQGGQLSSDNVVFEGNYQSLDQLTTIFSGLLFAHMFVGNVNVNIPEMSINENIDELVKAITRRILLRLKDHEWRIANWDGGVTPNEPGAGHNLILAAPLFEDIAARIIGPTEAYDLLQIGEENVNIIQLAIPKCRICDRIDELLTLDSWSSLLLLYPGLDIWYVLECTGLTGDCADEVISIEPLTDITGSFNILSLQMSDIRNAIESVETNDLDINTQNTTSRICLEIEKEITLGIPNLLGVSFEIPITICMHRGPRFGLLGNLVFQNIEDGMNEDNVHIFLELATCSNVWGFDYLTSQAYASDMDHYSLMHAILNHNGQPWGSMDQNWYKTYYLDTAPCEGPYAHPYETEITSGPIWGSQNRLFHPGNAENGPLHESGVPQTDFRGEFSGLDYMLYHNLYYMLWGDAELYQRGASCSCIEQITNESALTSAFEVKPKFDDYKSMGIPIESYLAHNLIVSSITGKLSVKNDLIICRENPDLQTVLAIEDGATLELFAENTITVREGNKIHITSGGILKAGINEIAGQSKQATIILEKNAELVVEDGSSILCLGGLHLVMKEGSKFILNDSECVPDTYANNGITFQTDQAEIHITESQLCSNNNSETINSNFVRTDFTSNNSLIRFERNLSAVYEATATESSFIFTGDSRFNLSMPFVHSLGEVEFWDDTKLIIDDGVLTIGDQVTMLWRSNDCRIIHEDSHLVFDGGKLNIPANHTFIFTYPNAASGYVEVMPGTENMLLTGNGSIFKLMGESNEDVVLKINEGAHIQNSVFHAGNFILQDCKVDCKGSIFTDMEFQASNVTFDGSGSIANWTSHPIYHNCIFNQMFISSYWCKLLIENCQSDHSHFYVKGGYYFLNKNDFMLSKIESEKLQNVSLILACNFSNDDGEVPYLFDEYQFIDESLVEVKFTNCTFNGLHKCNGAFKEGGTLSLSCCLFDQCPNALFISKGTVLNMSTNSFAGNNQFTSCDIMVHCQDAFNVLIDRGYNDFSDVGTSILSGNLIMYICDFTIDGCILPELPANYNIWPQGGDAPGWPMMDLHAISVPGCNSSTQSNCPMTIVDGAPIESFLCALTKPITEVTKSLIVASQGGIQSSRSMHTSKVHPATIMDGSKT